MRNFLLKIRVPKGGFQFFGTRILWCWGQIVHLNFLIDKLHKAVSVLFRCTKIRKSKPAWVRFSQSDVNGNNESSMTRCCLVLPSGAEHHCVLPGSLRFTNFLPKSQKQSRLCAICQSLCCECTICPQHHYHTKCVYVPLFFVYKKPANTVKQELDKSEREQF